VTRRHIGVDPEALENRDKRNQREVAKIPNLAAIHQPAPVVHPGGCIQDLVLADITARRDVGIERYGTPLQAHNGRDAMMDAYQEALDLCCYLRQVIFERDGR